MTPQEELIEIARLIQARTSEEKRKCVPNVSIGGGQIRCNNSMRNAWIVNYAPEHNYVTVRDITGEFRGTEMSGRTHTLHEYGKNSVVITKNHPVGQRLLRQFGTNIQVGRMTYDFLSSYVWGTSVDGPIKMGTVNLGKYMTVRLKDLLDIYFKAVENSAPQADDTEPSETSVAEEKKTNVEISKEALEILERELAHLAEVSQDAYRFIREQAALRNNPILDERQDEAKFAHVFDGVTEVIDGGPGTGKTTTLIQRLKYLISPEDINAQREDKGEKILTKAQIEVINQERGNWIFFSPTPLLCKYLQSNMQYEGLVVSDNTYVWADYLSKILRDEYQFFGKDYPFDAKQRQLSDVKIFKGKNLKVVKSFEGFHLKALVAKIAKVASLDPSIFKWKFAATLIVKTCTEIKDAHSFTDLLRGLVKLLSIRTEQFGEGTMSVQQVIDEYNSILKNMTLSVLHQLKCNDAVYNDLLKLVASWEINEEDHSEIEESEEIVDYSSQSRENRLNSFLRNIIRKLAIMKIDSKESLSSRQNAIYEKTAEFINEERLLTLSPYAYFYQNFIPVRNIETFIFGSITANYKRFRADSLKKKSPEWYLKPLEIIVKDNKNRLLHQQERSLLLGYINNLMLTFRKTFPRMFDELKHKYAVAYKNIVRPIIGVDEATDYTLYDYYAIASLRHPVISSMTLTGDIMQCLNESGVTDWKILKNPLIFPKLHVCELTVSYRQSPKLLTLAEHLYEASTGNKSPYRGQMEDRDDVPKPLWFDSDNQSDKAQWIVDRILEVKKAYKKVPSIAVFVASAEQIPQLREDMLDSEELENQYMQVIDCSNGLVDAQKDTIRLFPIDMVKGMEFEVVFFHDIQNIKNTKLIDKYLYIGLSRASFYMGVTSATEVDDYANSVKELFTLDGNWSNV